VELQIEAVGSRYSSKISVYSQICSFKFWKWFGSKSHINVTKSHTSTTSMQNVTPWPGSIIILKFLNLRHSLIRPIKVGQLMERKSFKGSYISVISSPIFTFDTLSKRRIKIKISKIELFSKFHMSYFCEFIY